MKKLICVIPITILICILLSTTNVFASSVPESSRSRCIWLNGSTTAGVGGTWYLILASNSYDGHDYETLSTDGSNIYYNTGRYGTASYSSGPGDYSQDNNVSPYTNIYVQFFVSNGAIVSPSNTPKTSYNSIEDYYQSLITPTPSPTPTPEPKWYQEMWDTLADELGQPEFWFGEWFIDIIDQVFNNEDEPSQGPSGLSHSTHINQVTPAPTPTPIPYSTITVPRTDIINNTTVYETQYVYTSSSGDTIIATSPPTNPPAETPSSAGGGGGSDYNPIDPYSIPEVSWFTSAEIGDTSYDGIDSLMHGFDSIDTIGEDYTDGMSAAEDSMGLLPTSWLLLIGVAAAIPLIAGIISRFLS